MRRLVLAVIAVVALLGVPGGAAFAVGEYSVDELASRVEVAGDASVDVVERQTVTFEDRCAGLTWYLHRPDEGESVRIASVLVAPADNGGTLLGGWTRLQMVDSRPDAQGEAPGDVAAASLRSSKVQPWYSYSIGDGMMRCYFPTGASAGAAPDAGDADSSGGADGAAEDYHTYIVETHYSVSHYADVYRDVAELSWRYAHDSLPVDAGHVSLQVVLPVPAEADAAAVSEGIRAWGHSPDGGSFAIGGDGTVSYQVDAVSRGNYADAHVIFPASWVAGATRGGANLFSEIRGPAVISEESEWVDIGLREAAWDNKVRLVFLLLALAVILVGALSAVRHGRSPLARRAVVRMAATLGVLALGEQLFFREPVTTAVLGALAVCAAGVALVLPLEERGELQVEGAGGV